MNTQSFLKVSLSLCAAGITLFSAATTQAAVTFNVNINTAVLTSSASAPFSLNFQLNNAGGGLTNTATISNFTFGGGSFTGLTTTTGMVIGNLGTTVTLTSDPLNPFNDFFQGFTPGSSLGFDVTLDTNVNSPTDVFTVGILDSALANITTDGLGNSLVQVDLSSSAPAVLFSNGTGAFAGVAAAPEPSRAMLIFAGVGAAAFRRRRLK